LISDHPDSKTAVDITGMTAEPLALDLAQLIYILNRQGDEPGEAPL
jgi:hypothetical protein